MIAVYSPSYSAVSSITIRILLVTLFVYGHIPLSKRNKQARNEPTIELPEPEAMVLAWGLVSSVILACASPQICTSPALRETLMCFCSHDDVNATRAMILCSFIIQTRRTNESKNYRIFRFVSNNAFSSLPIISVGFISDLSLKTHHRHRHRSHRCQCDQKTGNR